MSVRTNVIARVAIVALVALVCTAAARAQVKIGYVNTQNIIQELPEIKQIDEKLNTLQTAVSDTIRAMESNLKARLDAYQRRQGMMVPDAKTKEEDTLRAMDQQLSAFRDDRRQMLQQMQEKFMQPIRDKVAAAIERVAKEEKFTAILDRGAFLYIDNKLDLTYKVLDYLKRGN